MGGADSATVAPFEGVGLYLFSHFLRKVAIKLY